MFQPILLCCVKNIVFKGQTLETFYNQGYHSKKTTARWVYFRNTKKKEISKYQKKNPHENRKFYTIVNLPSKKEESIAERWLMASVCH